MSENNIKLTLLGGDLRQLAIARKLASIGFETAVWGLVSDADGIGDAVRCASWMDAVKDSSAIILPLPASSDGVHVNCSMMKPDTFEPLKMIRILDSISTDIPIIGGRFSPSFNSFADSRNFKVIDYFDSEELQIRNAVPTAEGALAIAMNELPITIHNARALVVGYGRVGKTLSNILRALGACVTVAARKTSDLAYAENCYCNTLKIEVRGGKSSLTKVGDGYDVIFNTVPCWLFDETVLHSISKNTLIIDLASAPGGVDMRAASECGVRVIWALSLPGKCAPFTAGEIICNSVLDILAKEGIIK